MTDDTSRIRLQRAKDSLAGLSVGDALGGYFFGVNAGSPRIQQRMVPEFRWSFSDDTNMALSIVSVLRQCGTIDQDCLAASFAEHYDSTRGYGPSMQRILRRITAGDGWRDAVVQVFKGQGSYGSGGAMRVAPLGAYWADDLELLVEQAQRSSEVTHAHPEGIAGAVAVAVAAGVAIRRGDLGIATPLDFIEQVWHMTPVSVVRERLRIALDLGTGVALRQAVSALGNGDLVSAQDTVPFAVWCAAQHFSNYEEALWLTISGGGDVDTNCAIVGGIVGASVGVQGIPAAWIERREALPAWFDKEAMCQCSDHALTIGE